MTWLIYAAVYLIVAVGFGVLVGRAIALGDDEDGPLWTVDGIPIARSLPKERR